MSDESFPASLASVQPHGDYIVFVDESGDHSLESVNPDYPIFVLAFCILPTAVYVEQVTPAVRRLKCQLFGHDLVVLHEHKLPKESAQSAGARRTSGGNDPELRGLDVCRSGKGGTTCT